MLTYTTVSQQRGNYVQPKVDPAMIAYGFYKKVAIPTVTWYRSRDSGDNGAPHHSSISLVPGGPPSLQRIQNAGKVSHEYLRDQ